MKHLGKALIALSVLSASSATAFAGTASTTLGVSLTITAGCNVSATPVAFGTASALSSAIKANGGVSVSCTNTTSYNIGLDQGGGSGASVNSRSMTGSSSATVAYALYQDSALTKNWGKTSGTDTVTGTGSGGAQSLIVYGQVAPQASPAPGSYADVVNVTVSY